MRTRIEDAEAVTSTGLVQGAGRREHSRRRVVQVGRGLRGLVDVGGRFAGREIRRAAVSGLGIDAAGEYRQARIGAGGEQFATGDSLGLPCAMHSPTTRGRLVWRTSAVAVMLLTAFCVLRYLDSVARISGWVGLP